MKIPCKVIEDLLPLYHDGVCSEESRHLVDEHLTQCKSCKAVLNGMMAEIDVPQENADDKKALKEISSKWKKSTRKALLKGVAIALAVVLVLFGGVSLYWYRTVVPFYQNLADQMEVAPDFPHEYGPTTPEQADQEPPFWILSKEYFLGMSGYNFWLRMPGFLDSHGSMTVEPAEAYGEITDKYGNVILHRGTDIHLAIYFTEAKEPEYYVTLMNGMDDLYTLLVLDGECNLLYTEDYKSSESLLRDQTILEQHQAEIKDIIDAAKEVWNLE